jgi:site-specific recombinase XerC
MATAFRFDTVRAMPLAALNRITGEVEVITKGGKVMQGKIDPKALGHVRSYRRLRPETASPALFVTETGKAIAAAWVGPPRGRCASPTRARSGTVVRC